METTLSQVAHEVLGVDIAKVHVVLGDTGLTPYSTGTYASRSMVMAGGAVSLACETLVPRLIAIGAHLMQCATNTARYENGQVVGPQASVTLAEIADAWYRRPYRLPPDVDLGGLEATMAYRPKVDTGAFSYASHAAVVAVDTELGHVEILDYVIAEDCGTLVNPMVADGQMLGGATQGIGSALYEESPYDANGQPLASTFADYLLPGPTEVPAIRIFHLETPSPYTAYGIKGMGEGGAIAPPAAIFNAVNDALRGLGVEVTETPLTPRRLLDGDRRARKPRTRMKAAGLRLCAPARSWAKALALLARGPGRRKERRSPAGSRWGRCSTSGSRDPGSWSTSRASMSCARSRTRATPGASARR